MSQRSVEQASGSTGDVIRQGRLVAAVIAGLTSILLASSGCGNVEPAQKTSLPVVEVAPVIERETRRYREWLATFDGYSNTEIRPQVQGYLLRRLYQEGSFVKKGDVLFEIDPRRFQAALDQAEGDLDRNKSALAWLQNEVGRSTRPALGQAIAQEEVRLAPSNMREALSNVDSARAAVEVARLTLAWTKVVSPIDGITGIARAQVGDFVDAQTLLTTVSSVDPIMVLFYVSRRDYLSWTKRPSRADRRPLSQSGRKGMFELILPSGALYPHRGDLLPGGRYADVTTGTIAAAAVFPNPDRRLRPGQHGRVRATVGVSETTLLVPQRAVFDLQGHSHVAVVGPDNKADLRAVRTGEQVGFLRVIEQGLDPGDRVIVEGFGNVESGIVVRPKPAQAEPVLGAGAKGGGE